MKPNHKLPAKAAVAVAVAAVVVVAETSAEAVTKHLLEKGQEIGLFFS